MAATLFRSTITTARRFVALIGIPHPRRVRGFFKKHPRLGCTSKKHPQAEPPRYAAGPRHTAARTPWAVTDLFDYWEDYPPTHVLVAAYLGAGKRSRRRRSRDSKGQASLEEVKRAIASAGGGVKKVLPEVYRAD